MKKFPYIGVTGFMPGDQNIVFSILESAFHSVRTHRLMVGVLASSKTFKGKYSNRYPKVMDIENCFLMIRVV